MAWANIALLGVGGLLVSVPVLIHFLMQPKPVEVVFPAMRFLKEKQLINRSRNRLRHLLLMLLRCILIGLLVLALAGPSVASQQFGKWLTFGGISFIAAMLGIVLAFSALSGNANKLFNGILATMLAMVVGLAGWYGLKLFDDEDSGQLLGDDGEPVSALVLLDTSPTMQYQQQNETRLTEAAGIAKWIVEQFPVGSQICVASVAGDQPFFSVDGAAAVRRIESLKTSYAPRTIPETLADAWTLVEKSPLQRKEVYVISDLTRAGWAVSGSQAALNRLAEDKGVGVFVVDVGVEDPVDFSLGSLELSTRKVTTNGSIEVSASVNRIGAASQRTVQLTVEKPDTSRPVVRDGKALFPENTWSKTQTIDIRENGQAKTKLEFQESLPPGVYHGKVEIVGSDPLAVNDQQYFTFEVSEPWQALTVSPVGTDATVIRSVIAPQSLGNASFEETSITQQTLSEMKSLDQFQAVFLVDPGPLAEETWQMLEDHVVAGGGLAIFLGHNAAGLNGLPDPSFFNPTARKLLTGSLTVQFHCPDRSTEPFLLSPSGLQHPILAPFRRVSGSIPWYRNPVFTFWGIEPDNNEEEKLPTGTVINFSNFEPALIERQIGLGRVVVMTTPVSEPANLRDRETWNQLRYADMQAWASFVVLHGIARYIVNADSDSLDIKVGQVASLTNDLTRYPDTWAVFSPDPEKPPAKVGTVGGNVSYRFTDTPGHYRLKGALDGPVLRGFSANLDPASIDMTRIEPDELDKVLGAGRYQLAKQKDEITRQQGHARKGREFYPLLMMMLFAAIMIEYLVSNRFYKA